LLQDNRQPTSHREPNGARVRYEMPGLAGTAWNECVEIHGLMLHSC
jgi:hypothetical protein